MSDAPTWKGTIRKGTEPGTIVGELRDEWGWVLHITGTFDEATRTYSVTGTTGEVPPGLRVAAIDEGK